MNSDKKLNTRNKIASKLMAEQGERTQEPLSECEIERCYRKADAVVEYLEKHEQDNNNALGSWTPGDSWDNYDDMGG